MMRTVIRRMGPSAQVRRTLTSVSVCLALMLAPTLACAALDPEVDKPYRLLVVLQIARHPLLTEVFKDQLERELRDSLQASLGNLAKVEVTHEHPLLKEIDANGLQQVLDGYGVVSDTKTHFVLLDYQDGQYDLRSLQHDGFTGMAGPVVRRDRTNDRCFVARLAALRIDRDLGMVGSLETNAKELEVRVILKAGRLKTPLTNWVKPNEVFAIARITKARDQLRGKRVDWALLQVLEEPTAEGVCRCRLFQRYANSLAGGGSVQGYRCIKLATTTAQLRLRLVDDRRLRPLAAQEATLSRFGFDTKVSEGLATDGDGLLVSNESYENVVFLKLLSGATLRARIPVEILDDRTLMVCPLAANADAEARGQLALRQRQWEGPILDSLVVVNEAFKDLRQLVEAKKNEESLRRAKALFANLQADIIARGEERLALREALKTSGLDQFDLANGERALKALETQRDSLQRFITSVETVVQQANDPKRAELLGMLERARLLEEEAEYGQSIDLNDKIVQESAEQPKIRALAEENAKRLRKAWTTQNDAHQAARTFIYETWPKQTTVEKMRTSIAEASKAFETCRMANDRLAPRKLLKVNLALANVLKKRLDVLQPKESEDDRKEAEAIAEVAERLKKLIEDASTFLTTPKP